MDGQHSAVLPGGAVQRAQCSSSWLDFFPPASVGKHTIRALWSKYTHRVYVLAATEDAVKALILQILEAGG